MHYIEFTMIPSSEIPAEYIWSKVFHRIHTLFVTINDKTGNVPLGFGFPDYSMNPPSMGVKLRLFAEDPDLLRQLEIQSVLRPFSDYCHISNIRDVPRQVKGYVEYKRYQPKNSFDRMVRRKAKRNNLSLEAAEILFQGFQEDVCLLPYIKLRSHSSNQSFSLFIKKNETSHITGFSFSTYGLSKKGAVPDF